MTSLDSTTTFLLLLGVVSLCFRSSVAASDQRKQYTNDEREKLLELRKKAIAEMAAERKLPSEEEHNKMLDSHLPLFKPYDEIQVFGPSSFPKPTDISYNAEDVDSQGKYLGNNPTNDDSGEIFPHMKPVLGVHRPDRDAILAQFSEFPFSRFLVFIQSVRDGGFEGDIVLAISSVDFRKKQIRQYLSSPGIVVYTPDLQCYTLEGEGTESMKGGSRLCHANNIYARKNRARDAEDNNVTAIPDPRTPRTIQTMRYEFYWIMAQNYEPHSWILLVDARDTYFQSNPFTDVPRKTDPSGESGVLYFFGENMEATRLGQSKHNQNWLTAAYGSSVAKDLSDRPTICSGTTMGEQVRQYIGTSTTSLLFLRRYMCMERITNKQQTKIFSFLVNVQVAVDAYLRAMVAEADQTKVTIPGADQGFHNFLYYSNKLKNTLKIHDIVVFDQGRGIVNNLGALRTDALNRWGNGKIVQEKEEGRKRKLTVLNWDGIPSPVVHQYDRHRELSDYFFKQKSSEYLQKWNKVKPN